MKSILVPVEAHEAIDATLEVACVWAREFDSYIEGFALRPNLPAFVGADALGATLPYVYPERDEEIVAAAHDAFVTAMQRNGIAFGEAGQTASCGWRENVLPGDSAVGIYGRVFDITVVGRPASTGTGPRMSTLEGALFESGRPILIAPPVAPRNFGDDVLVAWNGSTETSRAIGFAWPLLDRASRVVILTVEGGSVPEPSGDEVARYLRRKGVAAEAVTVAAGKRTVGEAILEQAKVSGADILIKGAYTQSRLRQMIFGGSTRHIIAEAELPVFMAH